MIPVLAAHEDPEKLASPGGEGKKNCKAPLFLGNDEPEAAGTEMTSAWTGEKKTEICLRTGEYEDWEHYRETCSTHEGESSYGKKLLSNTKLIEFFLTDSSYEEFMWSVRFDNTWYKYYTGLFVDIWKRVAKQKIELLAEFVELMNFKEALKEVYDEGKYTVCRFEWKYEFESNGLNPGPMERLYNRHLGHIDEKAEEGGAYQLIMEAVKKIVLKRKTYYDYAKKKLDIAKEIGLA